MNSKNVLLRIIQLKPNLLKTQVIKLAYLFDLAFVQLTKKPKTHFPYKWWHFGPYCREIEEALWDLEEEEKIRAKAYKTLKGYDCTPYEPLIQKCPQLEEMEQKVLDYLIQKFGKKSVKELEEFVYLTPPMQEAKQKNSKFKQLNLRSKKGLPAVFFDLEVAQMILNSQLSPKKKPVSFSAVWEMVEQRKKEKFAS